MSETTTTQDRRPAFGLRRVIRTGGIALLYVVAPVGAYFVAVMAADRVTPQLMPRATVNGLSVDADALALGEVWEHPQHVVRLKVVHDSGTPKVVERFAGSCGTQVRFVVRGPDGKTQSVPADVRGLGRAAESTGDRP